MGARLSKSIVVVVCCCAAWDDANQCRNASKLPIGPLRERLETNTTRDRRRGTRLLGFGGHVGVFELVSVVWVIPDPGTYITLNHSAF